MDAAGHITQYKLGNKVTTVKTFDPQTQRLKALMATTDGQANGNVLNQNYNYDALGNLLSRNDKSPGVGTQESFSYDSLNRLTMATILGGAVSPPTSTQVMYDPRGNIAYKSDVGRYWYDPERPNRMTNVTLETAPGATIPLSGTRALSYTFDDYNTGAMAVSGSTTGLKVGNGNLTYTVSRDTTNNLHTTRFESYTSFNMPLSMTYSNFRADTSTCPQGYKLSAGKCTMANTTTTLAKATYSCPTGQTMAADGKSCNLVTTMGLASKNYGCPLGYYVFSIHVYFSCLGYNVSAGAYRVLPVTTSYSCPAGQVVSGTSCTQTTVKAANVSYSCASGQPPTLTNTCTETKTITVELGSSNNADRTLTFTYGPEHQRIRQNVMLTGNGTSSYFTGDTWYLNGEDSLGLTYEKEVRANGTTEHKHYLSAGGEVFALFTSRAGNLNGLPASTTSYFQHDHLGSIAAITNEQGVVTERMAYDPWGKRRNINRIPGQPDVRDALYGVATDRGFTEHEHLDEIGVIHMNGRVYDPLMGRFMSADPMVQAPEFLQSYNRYAYVINNPLALTDPSGYNWLEDTINHWANVIQTDAGARTVVALGIAYFTGQWVGGLYEGQAAAAILNGGQAFTIANGIAGTSAIIGGFAGGLASSLFTSNGDVNAGLQGGITGAAFGWAGGVGDPSSLARYAAHASAGCVTTAMGGGNCGQGAAAAVFGKFTSNNINFGNFVANGVATVVAGGVGSVIGGGKFENGAKTAAYGYLFNQMSARSRYLQDEFGIRSSGCGCNGFTTALSNVVQWFNELVFNGADTPANTPDPASGSDPDRGGLTKAGRAQQKHGDRVGSAFDPAKGTPQDKNAQGQSTVDSIVNSPDRVDKPNRHGGIDVLQGPGQRGARFGPDGKFTGFLEP
jgi:RHS repeat-associated protein